MRHHLPQVYKESRTITFGINCFAPIETCTSHRSGFTNPESASPFLIVRLLYLCALTLVINPTYSTQSTLKRRIVPVILVSLLFVRCQGSSRYSQRLHPKLPSPEATSDYPPLTGHRTPKKALQSLLSSKAGIGVMLGLYWASIGKMEHEMETTI